MAKLDAFSMLRGARAAESREFWDPDHEQPLVLALRAPDAADSARAAEAAGDLTRDYITGDKTIGRAAGPFPDPDVKVSENLFLNCALTAEMQDPALPDHMRYSALELVLISSKMPVAWREVASWVQQLLARRSDERGKSPGATTGSSAA